MVGRRNVRRHGVSGSGVSMRRSSALGSRAPGLMDLMLVCDDGLDTKMCWSIR